MIVHLIQGSLHQPGNRIFLIPDQKRIFPHISGEQQQRKKKSVSEITSFITSMLTTDTRLQGGNKNPLVQKEACVNKKANLRILLVAKTSPDAKVM